ncbi:isoleucine--tRNA ligase [Patescibacteria group bacterium]|nr:isoleucine--tRNA ligase [Patescibacteria group bacterium]
MPKKEQPTQEPSNRPDYPKIEEEVAVFWEKERIFERSIEERSENKTYAFYDGPPFATGLPHYGHLLQSALKDAVPRYWTMKGYRVQRRWGWDCHGLPIENLVEKDLKLGSKRDIEKYGIGKFNKACRESVMTYAQEWGRYVKRLGRWVDFENAYKTMDNTYIESVWWVFSELYKKGFVYKDLRVSLYCPRCATPLSNFEIAMGDSYEEHEDPAITVKFKVKGEKDTYFLAWTTTPWTLPANVAIVAHPDLVYVKVHMDETNETLIFAKDRMNEVLKQHYPLKTNGEARFEVISRLKGKELEGIEYEPLYTFMPVDKKAYRVVTMDYVSAEDGTGLVHTAPAFGEEDFQAAKKYDLPVLITVDEEGRQKPEIGPFANMPVKESDEKVIEDLEERGLLYRSERDVHTVPVCWRCNTALLHKAQPAWYVDVTELKKNLLKTAKKINWHPDHFKEGRFGKGLGGAPDWCISRTRYWGAPLPVWTCEKCDQIKVVGSVAELDQEKEMDLHRPDIDGVEMKCSCGGNMTRVPEVFDCWFESGSMPYASEHYPFENKNWFDANYPADFIAEAQDQTRGWFYSLHVLATALFNKPAFKDVVVTGLVMAEDGKKMSKKLKNYPDPWDVMTTLGSDSLRLYLLSSPVLRAEQLNFSVDDCQMIQRNTLGLLWNIRNFFLTYSGDKKIKITKPRSSHVLDRWIFSRLMELEMKMTDAMDNYDLVEATRTLRPFIDDFSTWWLRRSRERIKSEDKYDRADALRTLKEVLLEMSLLMAPFAPFFAEKLYGDMGGVKDSVHLDKWPKPDERLIDSVLLDDMKWARDVVTHGLEARASSKIPVRQALSNITVFMSDATTVSRLEERPEIIKLIRDELNVEEVKLKGGAKDIEEPQKWRVELDTRITPELKRKGLARELVRHFMNLRKQAGLVPNDVVAAEVTTADADLKKLFESVQESVAKEFKAESLSVTSSISNKMKETSEVKLDGKEIKIGLIKIS